MIFVSVDLDVPEQGPPGIAYPRADLAAIPVVMAVIPPRGDEEDAKLFAVVRPDGIPADAGGGGPVFADRRRAPAPAVTGHVLEPIDPQAIPRLFERGGHPGDLQVMGLPKDARGRSPIAALCFLDLSQGLRSSDALSTPMEVRIALAEACSYLGEEVWREAAGLLDPASLMRDGMVPVTGGMPMTEAAFHQHMMEGAALANGLRERDSIPMVDYRLFDDRLLVGEIRGDARAILSVQRHQLHHGHPAHRLLSSVVDLASALDRKDGQEAKALLESIRQQQAMVAEAADQDPVCQDMMRGVWAGAHLWRNLFSAEGTLATAERRLATPGCDAAVLDRMSLLAPEEARAFRDPGTMLLSQARRVDDLPRRLADPHRPFLLLPPARLAVAPATSTAISRLDKDGLCRLIGGNSALLDAFRDLPNRHPEAPQARDALIVGLARLGLEAQRRGMDAGVAGMEFSTDVARVRPWLLTRSTPSPGVPSAERRP